MSQKSLSADLLAVAADLRAVRSRLVELVRDGQWPEGSFPDLSTVQVYGLEVANALERLAKGGEPEPKAPTYLDERR